MSSPSLILSPVNGSFPFAAKNIPMTSGTRIIMGSHDATSGLQKARVPPTKSGWFPPQQPPLTSDASVSPLSLSSHHAEVWYTDGKPGFYIRDLDSAFGTYVNGKRISKDTALREGDIIILGTQIERNDKTPAYITELHLSPVVAKVSLSSLS